MRSEYWTIMVEILDHCFPKGKCKERGAALVMLAFIEMRLQGKTELLEELIKKL